MNKLFLCTEFRCIPSNKQRLEKAQVTGIPCPSNDLNKPWCNTWPTNHIPAFAGSLQVTGYSTVRFPNLQDLLVRIIFAWAVIALFSCQCHVLSLVPSLCTSTGTALILCCLPLLFLLPLLLLPLLLRFRLLRFSRFDQARRNVPLDPFFKALWRPSNVTLLTCTVKKGNYWTVHTWTLCTKRVCSYFRAVLVSSVL